MLKGTRAPAHQSRVTSNGGPVLVAVGTFGRRFNVKARATLARAGPTLLDHPQLPQRRDGAQRPEEDAREDEAAADQFVGSQRHGQQKRIHEQRMQAARSQREVVENGSDLQECVGFVEASANIERDSRLLRIVRQAGFGI